MSQSLLESWRNAIVLALAKSTLWLCSRLPLETARLLGRWLGQCFWALDTRGRRIAERNIALAYPHLDPSEQAALVNTTLRETGALAAEMGHVWLMPWKKTERLITHVEGAHAVTAALNSGRGVIVLAPHLGNWEMLGLHLATLGDMVALFEPPKIASLGPLIHSARERSGGKLVPTTSRGIAAITKSVKQGGISGILPDQVPNTEVGAGIVPFMGVACSTAALAVNLVRRSNAQAFMGAAFRVPGGFKVCYVPAPAELYVDDQTQSLTAMNRAVEDLLRGWDAQYQWIYKRFRCRPPGDVNHYHDLKSPRNLEGR